MEPNLKLSGLISKLQAILEAEGDIAVGVECHSDERMMLEGDLRVADFYVNDDGEEVDGKIVMITTWG